MSGILPLINIRKEVDMTQNQLRLMENREAIRAKKAEESETRRSNLAKEAELYRHNVAMEEATRQGNLINAYNAETQRVNAETNMGNLDVNRGQLANANWLASLTSQRVSNESQLLPFQMSESQARSDKQRSDIVINQSRNTREWAEVAIKNPVSFASLLTTGRSQAINHFKGGVHNEGTKQQQRYQRNSATRRQASKLPAQG
nr:putative ORF1 [Marmot picobirnavirus]